MHEAAVVSGPVELRACPGSVYRVVNGPWAAGAKRSVPRMQTILTSGVAPRHAALDPGHPGLKSVRRVPPRQTLRGGIRLGLLVFSTILGLGGLARAQAVDDGDEPDVPNPINRGFQIDESNFDMWVFGNSRNAPTARTRVEAGFKLELEGIDRAIHLTDRQKKKLELAAQGDIKRFFDDVEIKRAEFQQVRNDQQKFGAFYQKLRPLQQALNQGIHNDKSLFAKTLKHSLQPGQSAGYEERVRQRRILHHRALLARVLALLDDKVALDRHQRQRLTRLIIEKTQPSPRMTNYDLFVILNQLAQLPDDQITPIFRDAQWPVMRQQLMQGKAFSAMLSQQGLLPDKADGTAWALSAGEESSQPDEPGAKGAEP